MNRCDIVDDKIRKLYADTFCDMHAPNNLSGKVLGMRNTDKKLRRSIKIGTAIALAAAVGIGSSAIASRASASKGYKGQYQTVCVNGTEVLAKYASLEEERFWFEVENGQNRHYVWIYGEYTPDQDMVYIEEKGDYIVASINEEPTLNLYDRIQDSSYGKLNDDGHGSYGIGIYSPYDGNVYRTFNLSKDEMDGARDGAVNDSSEYDEEDFWLTYTVAPNGSIINSYTGAIPEDQYDIDVHDLVWGIAWGEESQNALYEYNKRNAM